MRRILLLDDDVNVLLALQRSMRAHVKIPELRVELFSDPYEAIKRVCACGFDLVISDYHMPTLSGVAFLQAIKDIAPHTVRVMLTASTELSTAVSAINEAQVFRYIPKPWNLEDLQQTIAAALEERDRLMAEHGIQPPPPTPQELEAQRLEEEEPGILKVNWGPDGSIIL
ncbi:response regulator [Pseudoduganella namucuonensis]|uniref:Response regulator receiver domain-containing protein n=1 Tax=Pseudoduganella namucuonensis TaxID=1035707 RepID=A0A1I7J5G3_9BURK|nr:response regulator [Pseudoduganella namucuonensis]SFU80435.1 Response regulator receiver domain-containing protein [Pseudoduganella namucuonensis]